MHYPFFKRRDNNMKKEIPKRIESISPRCPRCKKEFYIEIEKLELPGNSTTTYISWCCDYDDLLELKENGW